MKIGQLILILLFYVPTSINAQNNAIIIHEALGDIIDIKEKTRYLLFPEIADSIYDYSTILSNDSNYIVYTHLLNNTFQQRIIDTTELNHYFTNIEKLEAYYRYMDNKKNQDSIKLDLTKNPADVNTTGKHPLITNDIRDKIYDGTLYYRPVISDDIHRKSLKENGFLTGDEMPRFYYPNRNKK